MWDVRYRPARFSDVLGQTGAIQVLKARLKKGTALDTSYIFSGGHGQGKTTLARILARAMLCQQLTEDQEPCNQCDNCQAAMDESSAALIEMDAASKGKIEHARAIVDQLPFVILNAPKKVYIIDEAHRMSVDAQDVLLKPVEEKRLVGIFCTTEPEKIRGPIRSRCEEHPIRRITRDDVLKRMKWVLEQEKVEYQDDAVLTVIDHSGGHIRDILNKLEMVAQLGPVTLEAVREYLNLSVISTYYEILLALANPTVAIPLADSACDRVGPEAVLEGLAEAAMNSYRLAHGMFADFTFTDKELAAKVFATYGEATPKLAEHFLRSYRATRMGLLSDILSCVSGVPTAGSASESRVVVQVAAVPTVQTAIPPSPAPKPPVAIVAEPPKSDPAPAVEAQPKPINDHGRRPDGVGNKGSSDTRALTSEDTKGVPLNMPRGHEVKKVAIPKGAEELILTPEEWRRLFASRCGLFSAKGID